jgi:hypothetical protein
MGVTRLITTFSTCGKQRMSRRVRRGDGRVGEAVMTNKSKRGACEGRD